MPYLQAFLTLDRAFGCPMTPLNDKLDANKIPAHIYTIKQL